jgi:N-acetylglutamate synthase-like GNAT family acetyltransferase
MPDASISPVEYSELPFLASILTAVALPADDIADAGRIFLRFHDRTSRTIGFGGLEFHGPHVLFRSITVMPEDRGQGWGQVIVDHLTRQARLAGAAQAYLLTTSARSFFEAQGFTAIGRSEAPAEILATRQASGLCPATAIILTKALTA